jgi:aromatic-L-amino-acid/L-tryptophan decarboxylase
VRLIEAEPRLELLAPAPINIVCFRHRLPGADPATLKTFKTEVMLRLQEAGTVVQTDTTLRGQHGLRVAIANHRTRCADLDLFISEVLRIGAGLQND